MSTTTSPAGTRKDPIADLALQIYVGMASRIYGDAAGKEGAVLQPRELAHLSFRLAEAFHAEDRAANPVTIAAAAAAKAAVKFDAADLDLGSLHHRR